MYAYKIEGTRHFIESGIVVMTVPLKWECAKGSISLWPGVEKGTYIVGGSGVLNHIEDRIFTNRGAALSYMKGLVRSIIKDGFNVVNQGLLDPLHHYNLVRYYWNKWFR